MTRGMERKKVPAMGEEKGVELEEEGKDELEANKVR